MSRSVPVTSILTHNNTYSGGTIVGGGTLLANNVPAGDAFSATGSGPVQVFGGGTLGGFGTIAGPVTVGGGEGIAILAPGDGIGRLSMLNALTMASNGQVNIELGGATAATGYDQAFIDGTLTLEGTLNVKLVNGFVPFAGEKFYILDVTGEDSVSGKFTNVLNGLYTDAAGNLYRVSYNDSDPGSTDASRMASGFGNDVSLTFIAAAVPEPPSFVVAGLGLAAGLARFLHRSRLRRAL